MDYLETPEFEAHIKDLLLQHHVPGISIAVTHNGKDTAVSFGQASIDPPKHCSVDTLFDIASSSKSLTAAAVALLVEDDETYPEIKWDTPVSTLLPDDFVLSKAEYTAGITVEDILCHRTGMANHDLSVMGRRAAIVDDARSVTRNLRNLPICTPLRADFIYNNNMFTVATHLIETKTGISFSDFLEERILQPLGMRDTSLQPHRAITKGHGERIAMRHTWHKSSDKYRSFPAFDCTEGQGAGSIITSARDYLKWVKAMMNKEGPVTQEVYEAITKPRMIRETDLNSMYPHGSMVLYALGLEVFWYRGHMVFVHNGLITGFGSTHFFLPDLKFGAVVLGNADDADTIANILYFELIDELLQIPRAEREDWNVCECSHLADGRARYEKENSIKSLSKQLCPDWKEAQPQQTPLSAYAGKYHHAGYHDFLVQIKNNKLFLDASDRSDGYALTFEHVCDQTKYIAHLNNLEAEEEERLKAEFILEGGRAVRLGIDLDPNVDEYIWFDRV